MFVLVWVSIDPVDYWMQCFVFYFIWILYNYYVAAHKVNFEPSSIMISGFYKYYGAESKSILSLYLSCGDKSRNSGTLFGLPSSVRHL